MRKPQSVVDTFSELRNDYNAAKVTRFRRQRKGVNVIGRSADYHYRLDTDFIRMMETARDIDRNDIAVGQGIGRVVQNVIQDGFIPDPDTGDPELDADLKQRWNEWSVDPERVSSSRKFTFHDLEKLSFRQTLVDGDIFALPLTNGTFEMVEAHRVRTPLEGQTTNIAHGVELNQNGAPTRYFFTKRNVNPNSLGVKRDDMQGRRAFDDAGFPEVIHVYNPERTSQNRGVTVMARVVDAVSMHDDIEFATLIKRQLASCWGMIHKSDNFSATPTGSTTQTQYGDGTPQYLEGVSPGMRVKIPTDDEIDVFSANVTENDFQQHVMLVLSLISVNLGIPLAVLLLDPSKTNFSGWRGAIDQARQGFRDMQRWMRRRFHTPVYRWKVRQWIAQDSDLAARSVDGSVDIYRHKWNAPAWDYIEPAKDAASDLLQVRNGLNSPRRIQARRGRDWEMVSTEIVQDNVIAIRKAKMAAAELNDEFPDDGNPVHWRECLSLPTPDGVQVNITGEVPDDAAQTQETVDD